MDTTRIPAAAAVAAHMRRVLTCLCPLAHRSMCTLVLLLQILGLEDHRTAIQRLAQKAARAELVAQVVKVANLPRVAHMAQERHILGEAAVAGCNPLVVEAALVVHSAVAAQAVAEQFRRAPVAAVQTVAAVLDRPEQEHQADLAEQVLAV